MARTSWRSLLPKKANVRKFVAAIMVVCIVLNLLGIPMNLESGRYDVALLNVIAIVFCWLGIPPLEELGEVEDE